MTLQNNLESTIALHWIKGPRAPQCIIAHPKTVIELMREVFSSIGTQTFLPLTKDIKYKGILVYRSEDVDLNKFEIY